MSKILISGPIAYDNIMRTKSNLKDNLSLHDDFGLNLSYEIYDFKKYSGGAGMNIAYNIALLGGEPILLSSAGIDFIFSDFVKDNVDIDNVYISDEKLTANYFLSSDNFGNKIHAFFPGAICDGCKVEFKKKTDIKYSVISSDYIPNMIQNIELFSNNNYKIFFNPGHQINQLLKEELIFFMEKSDYLVVSYSEYEKFKKVGELSDEEMISSFEKIVITYGIKGSKIFDNNYNMNEIVGVENPNFVDDTGAGDSYLAGLIFGLNEGFDWLTSAQIGAVLSSISVGKIGAQNHNIDWEQFKILYEDTFGNKIGEKIV